MFRSKREMFGCTACLLLWTGLALAQGSGKITGLATDNSGGVIPDAQVTASNPGTGDVRRTISNNAGVYVLSALPVGLYNVRAEKQGFKTITRPGMRIDVNSAITLDLKFEVGTVAENVTVEANATTIETENQSISSSRYLQQVQNLPVAVREVHQLIGLSPGVSYGLKGSASGNYTPSSGQWAPWQVIADGAELNNAGAFNNWTGIDGVGRRADLNSPNLDAIAEVHFTTTGGNAEYSQPTQGIVATKSGTDQYHGSAYEFYRSGGMGARRWEAARRDSFVRHQAGASFGGPIKKSKMFFFGAYELFRYKSIQSFNSRYPTAAERAGDLSGLLGRTDAQGRPAPVRLFDPFNKGQVFPNNVIPSSRLSPVALELLKLLPDGATPSGSLTAFNSVYTKPLKDNSDKWDARYDYNVNDANRLFARITWAHLDQASRYSGNVPGLFGGDAKKQWNAVVSTNWTRVMSPTLVASFQASFRSMPFKNTPTDGSEAFPIKINGLDPKPPFAGPPAILVGSNGLGIGSPDSGSPAGSFSGLFDRLLFNYQADYDYAFDPTITKIAGGHTFKAGFHFRRDYTTQELAGRPYGRYTTASDYNNAGSTVSATGDAFADFLLGLPSTTDVAIGKPGGWESGTTYGAFVQDSWKVNARLTLDLGVRYDSFGFFEEMNKRASIADFKTGKILIPHGGSANILPEFAPFASQFLESDKAGLPNTFVHPNRWNFSPRLGFAYRINNGFVARSAFGIYTVDTVGYINFDQVNNPPIVLRSQLTRNLLLSRGVDVNSQYTFQNPTAGLATAAANTLLSSMIGYTADYPAQRTYTWNFTLEKDLGHNLGARASYVGNAGRHIPRTVEVNACPPGMTVCLSRPAGDPTARALLQYDVNIGAHTADGQSHYHSMEVDLNRRFSNGLLFDVNYTWSKLLALATIATNPVAAPQWSYDLGPVPFAPPRILHFNYVYELPVGKGRHFASRMPAVAEAVLGGWTISGLST
ncbi:MAG TPA: TonB-dependent receptor, partial [Bryobacteraceae bacterium]|nr:TonB-dependent receptor [Bryobacteraceae bacterium]